ncbi:hypothetical protein COCON_G00174380 [Conger conger]|uniref:ATR-interacting protein n=1 Tax=Conger conger TaxID=82655 RepID=A0A9Q1D4H6_CONCO|nr:hypothetical protein COCON_G00174380 [Conger conger]
MEYAPRKGLKGLNDPFGDDEDFTQDDLDEIDIIASQAFPEDVGVKGPKETFRAVGPHPGAQRKPVLGVRKASALGGSTSSGQSNMGSIYQLPTAEAFGNIQQQFKKSKADLSYGDLEAQQAELQKKLKEAEEKLMMKDGEIRVLRDSIRHAQQEKEQERQSLLLQEKERIQAQSEKEKDILKKVQSLQSELHFKEAEMNEIKTKLQNSERGSKRVAPSAAKNSPRRHSPAVTLQDGSGGSGVSPKVSPFLTKESFAAQLSSRASPATADWVGHFGEDGRPRPVGEAHNNVGNDPHVLLQEFAGPEACQVGFTSSESALLNLLLQHPLDPSTLGLSHLLCLSPEALPGLLTQQSYLSPGSSAGSSGPLRARGRAPAAERLQPGAGPRHHHVGLFCQALEAAERPGRSPRGRGSAPGSSSEGLEESLAGLEEFALAALRALYHLLSHSARAVHALLSQHAPGPPEADGAPSGPARSRAPSCQHPLLRRLLQLADPAFCGPACQREKVLSASLTALNALAERAGDQLLCRMKLVVTSPFAARCLSVDSSYGTVSLSVSLLAVAAGDEEAASALFTPGTVPSAQNVPLELEVVRLLTMLFTQRTSTWLAFIESSCQCNNEVVRTLVMLLHRQWLKVRRWEYQEAWAGPGVQLLREVVTLLHWLLLNDGRFSERCLEVLHMYVQLFPGVRDTFRKIPRLAESEEMALEEICRHEAGYRY